MCLKELDRLHSFTSDVKAVYAAQTRALVSNQDQTTGTVPESYLNINREKRSRDVGFAGGDW